MSVRIKVRSRNLITTVVRDLKFTLKAVEQNRRLIQLTNTEIAERPCDKEQNRQLPRRTITLTAWPVAF